MQDQTNNNGDFMKKFFGIISLMAISFTTLAADVQAPKLKCFAKQTFPGMNSEPIVKNYKSSSTELKLIAEESADGFESLAVSAELVINENLKCVGFAKASKQGEELEVENLTVTMKTSNGSFSSGGSYFDRAAITNEAGVNCTCSVAK